MNNFESFSLVLVSSKDIEVHLWQMVKWNLVYLFHSLCLCICELFSLQSTVLYKSYTDEIGSIYKFGKCRSETISWFLLMTIETYYQCIMLMAWGIWYKSPRHYFDKLPNRMIWTFINDKYRFAKWKDASFKWKHQTAKWIHWSVRAMSVINENGK